VGKSTDQKQTNEKFSVKDRIFRPIGGFFVKITAPIRNNTAWKFLRRTVLRSPFRGYIVNSFKELKHVVWPDRKTSLKLTFTVIVFSAIFAAFTTTLDYGFEELAKRIFLR
jgi:preprotein translocase SecE subunit